MMHASSLFSTVVGVSMSGALGEGGGFGGGAFGGAGSGGVYGGGEYSLSTKSDNEYGSRMHSANTLSSPEFPTALKLGWGGTAGGLGGGLGAGEGGGLGGCTGGGRGDGPVGGRGGKPSCTTSCVELTRL